MLRRTRRSRSSSAFFTPPSNASMRFSCSVRERMVSSSDTPDAPLVKLWMRFSSLNTSIAKMTVITVSSAITPASTRKRLSEGREPNIRLIQTQALRFGKEKGYHIYDDQRRYRFGHTNIHSRALCVYQDH